MTRSTWTVEYVSTILLKLIAIDIMSSLLKSQAVSGKLALQHMFNYSERYIEDQKNHHQIKESENPKARGGSSLTLRSMTRKMKRLKQGKRRSSLNKALRAVT